MNQLAAPDKKQSKILFSLHSNEQQPKVEQQPSIVVVENDDSTINPILEINFEPAYEEDTSILPTAAEGISN
jgi:hypothetical protein